MPSFQQTPPPQKPGGQGSDGYEYPSKTGGMPTTPPIIAPPMGQDGGQPIRPQTGGVKSPFPTRGGIKDQPGTTAPPVGQDGGMGTPMVGQEGTMGTQVEPHGGYDGSGINPGGVFSTPGPASQNPNMGGGLVVNNPFNPQTPDIIPSFPGGWQGSTGFNNPTGNTAPPVGQDGGAPGGFNPPPKMTPPQQNNGGYKPMNPYSSDNPFQGMIQNYSQFDPRDLQATPYQLPSPVTGPQNPAQLDIIRNIGGGGGGIGGGGPAVGGQFGPNDGRNQEQDMPNMFPGEGFDPRQAAQDQMLAQLLQQQQGQPGQPNIAPTRPNAGQTPPIFGGFDPFQRRVRG